MLRCSGRDGMLKNFDDGADDYFGAALYFDRDHRRQAIGRQHRDGYLLPAPNSSRSTGMESALTSTAE